MQAGFSIYEAPLSTGLPYPNLSVQRSGILQSLSVTRCTGKELGLALPSIMTFDGRFNRNTKHKKNLLTFILLIYPIIHEQWSFMYIALLWNTQPVVNMGGKSNQILLFVSSTPRYLCFQLFRESSAPYLPNPT